MKRIALMFLAMLACLTAVADVVVSPSEKVGKVKLMNAVNNGPVRSGKDQWSDNFEAFRALRTPYARTHDAAFEASYGAEHTVDITAIFPDFSRKVDDPSAYDFAFTDHYLKTMRSAGIEPFFRLGQKIEHGIKKYGIMPPADYKKWARICEHIIRHYNEGWNNGYQWNIKYWEIWNEADLDQDHWQTNPRTWGGTPEEFFSLYEIAAKHLKKCFPNLSIGGPALAGNEQWAERFITYMAQHQVPIDFYSWHIYHRNPAEMAKKAERMRALIDKSGYGNAESILNEWNYVKGWTDEFIYSLEVVSSIKGAAFDAAVMNACQSSPVDMLMYYDARFSTRWNGLFDLYTKRPIWGYYAFYAWSKLLDYGTQVKAESNEQDIYVTAATGADGKLAVFVTRYNEDNNATSMRRIKIQLQGGNYSHAVGHLTDEVHMYTEIPLSISNNTIEVVLEPNAFVMIECQTN